MIKGICDMSGSNLEEADLRGANLKKAILMGANLKGAKIDKEMKEKIEWI